MKTRIALILIILVFVFCGCKNTEERPPINSNSTTPTASEYTPVPSETPENDEKNKTDIQYRVVNVVSLIDSLNEHYKDKVIQPFENHMMIGEPFGKIEYRYEFDATVPTGTIKSVSKFIQGRIIEEDTIINISVVEDKTFDNGGYIFSNANNFYYDYFTDDYYTMSIYKYNKSYIVFEFFSASFNTKNKKDFIADFAKLLEEKYSERDKMIYNENDEHYTVKTFLLNPLEEGLNVYYKDDIETRFTQGIKSETPLYEINERYRLDEISEEDNSILAVTKYIQGLLINNVKIFVIEDKTHDNSGYVFTTDRIENKAMVNIYRYNNLYIVFEFHNSSVTIEDRIKVESTTSRFSNMLINLLQ